MPKNNQSDKKGGAAKSNGQTNVTQENQNQSKNAKKQSAKKNDE